MEEGREAYRRGPGHGRQLQYEGPTSPREQFYGGPPRDAFRRPSYDQRFSSPQGRAGSFNGPVSPDRERLRAYSPERRPYSPDHDRRAYSPDRGGDRDRAPRYHLQERPNGYRPREEGFRREAYVYRGDENRASGRSRDPSPDHHHVHHNVPRDQLQFQRDRGPEPDPHQRPISREGTPLEGWAAERGVKPPHLHAPHGHMVSRGSTHASSAAPSSSGSLRDAVNADFGPSANEDLEAGEVAPAPGPGSSDLAFRPSSEQHHSHHHPSHHQPRQSYHGHHGHGQAQQHHGHHGGPSQSTSHRASSGTQLPSRGGATPGGWEPRSGHAGTGSGGHSGAALRDGPLLPPPRESKRDYSGRDTGRESSRGGGGRGDGGRDLQDGGREPRESAKATPHTSSTPAAVQTPIGSGWPEAGFSREAPARDRDRDHERSLRGSPLYAARSSSQGGLLPSPGRSPRGASSDGAVNAGTAGTAAAVPGQEPTERRWSSGEGTGGQQVGHDNNCGAASLPSMGPAPHDAQRRLSSASMDLDIRHSDGADDFNQLRQSASSGSSHGQAQSGDAVPPARVSTAGTAIAVAGTPFDEHSGVSEQPVVNAAPTDMGALAQLAGAESVAPPAQKKEVSPDREVTAPDARGPGSSNGNCAVSVALGGPLSGLPSSASASSVDAGPQAVPLAASALPSASPAGVLVALAPAAAGPPSFDAAPAGSGELPPPIPAAVSPAAGTMVAPVEASSAPAVASLVAPAPVAASDAEPGEVLSEGELGSAHLPGPGPPSHAAQHAGPRLQAGDPFGAAAWEAAAAAAPGAHGAAVNDAAGQASGRDGADGLGRGPERVPLTTTAMCGFNTGSAIGDDVLGTERKSSLTIRRFGFGRTRRSLPAKSAGDAPAEEGEPSGTSCGGAPELMASGPGRGQPASEAADGDARAAPVFPGIAATLEAVQATSLLDLAAATTGDSAGTGSGDLLSTLPPILTTMEADIAHGPFALPTPMTASTSAPTPGATPTSGASPPAVTGCHAQPGVYLPTSAVLAASVPMDFDQPNATVQDDVHIPQQQHQQPLQRLLHQQLQQADHDAANDASNPAETVAGLSLRIEHLETEITDLERQLAVLVSGARMARAEAVQLEMDVGALDEQLLQDITSEAEDESDFDDALDDGAQDPAAWVDRSGTSATGECDVVDRKAVVPSDEAQAAVFVPEAPAFVPAGPVLATVVAAAPEVPQASRGESEVRGDDEDEEPNAKPQRADEDSSTSNQTVLLKPRGRPRSTAKVRVTEAAAAAAAAEDSGRKAPEQPSQRPPDGLLHLPAHQFKPRFLLAVRASVLAWRKEALRLLPDDLAARVRAAFEATAAQQTRLVNAAPMPGSGRWATIVPLLTVRVEPMYREPQDLPAFHANAARHAAVCGAVARYLRQRRQLVAAKQEELVTQYTRHMASYKLYMQTEGRRPPAAPQPLPAGRGSAGVGSFGMYAASRAVSSYNPYAYSHSDVVRSDLDEQRLLNNFIAVEQLKHMCALPDMVLDPWERRWRAYDNRNGLVQDPVRELDEERMVKSWAEEERTQFMERFLQHPKDFRKISTYLPGRSPGDCVAFFYKNQKLDEFGTVRRKQQLKKRRLQADLRKQQYAPLLVAPMIARQRAMGPGCIAGELGVRGGNRGRGGVRSAAVRGPRVSTLMDPDHALGLGPHGMSVGGLPMAGSSSRPLSGGPTSLPVFQSMMAAAHHAAAVTMGAGGLTRELPSAPLLPPISSAGTSQQSSPAYVQQQAMVLPAGGSSGVGWTDDDFIECYRQHGKSWDAYCRHLGIRSESAAKQYYYRHKERLGLDHTQPNNLMVGDGIEASGATVIAAASAAGPGRKAGLAARLPTDQVSASAAVATAAAAAAAAAPAAAAATAPSAAAEACASLAEPFGDHADASLLRAAEDAGPVTEDEHVPQRLPGSQGHPPAVLIPKGASGRRRGPMRVPASAASLTSGPALGGVMMESSEASLYEGAWYKPDPDSDVRSDSEYDAVVQGGSGGMGPGTSAGGDAGGAESAAGNLQHIDLHAALRNPGGSSLTQLLRGGLLQAAGGQGGRVLSHLLLQQQHLEQQVEQRDGREQPQGLAALGTGLSPNVLGGMAGALQGGMGSAGGGGASGIGLSLFTGGSQGDDVSALLSSPGDEGGAGPMGLTGSAGAGSRRFGANYWSQEEKDTFYEVFQVHGRDWARLAEAIPTKSTSQIKTYFHNYKTKLGFDKMEVPASALQLANRRGQGRAVRDSAVVAPGAAAAAALAAAPGAGDRAHCDAAGDKERPAKRQATCAGPTPGQSGLLRHGEQDGCGDGTALLRVSAGLSKAASPPLPVMDLHALASVYNAQAPSSQGADLGQLLAFAASLQGSGPAVAGAAHLSAAGLSAAGREGDDMRLPVGGDGVGAAAQMRGPSPTPAGNTMLPSAVDRPASSSEPQQQTGNSQQVPAFNLFSLRAGDGGSLQALALARGPVAGLPSLQALNSASCGSHGTATLLTVGGFLSQQQQQSAPLGKLQALNLEQGPSDVLTERERAPGGLPAFRVATTAGGSGGLVLQDQHGAQHLNLQFLTSSVGEREKDRSRADRSSQLPLAGKDGLSSENAVSAPVLELLGTESVGQATTQALDLATPAQGPGMALDAAALGLTSAAALAAALDSATAVSRSHGDSAAAAAAVAAAGSGDRSARNSETAAGGGLSFSGALRDGVGNSDSEAGEPASKRQKRVSKEPQQSLDLGGGPAAAVASAVPPRPADAPAARSLTAEEQVAQHLLHHLHQQAAAGQRLVPLELLRPQEQRQQPLQRSAAAAPALNLGLTGLQVFSTSGTGSSGGNGLLRLIPLQAAPAGLQQQHQDGSGGNGVARVQLGAAVAVPMGQGQQAVSVADVLTSLRAQGGRDLAAQSASVQGAGAYGLGGASGLDRLLASAQDAALGATGGQFIGLQASRGSPGVGWPVLYANQLVSPGPRPPLNLAALLQQHAKEGERGGDGPNR